MIAELLMKYKKNEYQESEEPKTAPVPSFYPFGVELCGVNIYNGGTYRSTADRMDFRGVVIRSGKRLLHWTMLTSTLAFQHLSKSMAFLSMLTQRPRRIRQKARDQYCRQTLR